LDNVSPVCDSWYLFVTSSYHYVSTKASLATTFAQCSNFLHCVHLSRGLACDLSNCPFIFRFTVIVQNAK